jgi:hypothetical protein
MISRKLVAFGLYLIGYGLLCLLAGWPMALAIFLIQWAGNLQWEITHDQK